MIHNLQGIHETVDYKADTQICLYYNKEAENYPPHWHPSFEVIMPVINDYRVVCGHNDYFIKEGEILVICPCMLHELFAPATGERIIFQPSLNHIKLKELDLITPLLSPAILVTKEEYPQAYEHIHRLMLEIKDEYMNFTTYSEISIIAKFLEILVDIGRNHKAFHQQDGDRDIHHQKEYMESFWKIADVEIKGNEAVQQGIHFNLYHIIQAAGRDGHTGMGAKGLSGEGYEGHYFWDTEMYVLPVLIYTEPEVAKKLLDYRYGTLDQARERARILGHMKGALYPWRTINGAEASTYYPLGTAQYHINADIAYALSLYLQVSGDVEYLKEKGAEILIETARVWADVGSFAECKDGRYCICDVTGPDEYNVLVDNNFYTNLMARENLRDAVGAVSYLNENAPEVLSRLEEKIDFSIEEIEMWNQIIEKMYFPYDEKRQIYPMDDGFMMRKPWDESKIPPEKRAWLYENYHPLFIMRHRMSKQADAILGMYLHSNLFTEEEIRRNYDFYQEVTLHHSSLSTCIFGIVACDIGYLDEAYKYFSQSARMDLDDYHNNFYAGIHAANMAGTWQAIVNGFAGVRCQDSKLRFKPVIPKEWEEYRFRIKRKGTLLEVTVSKQEARFKIIEGDRINFWIGEKNITLKGEGDQYVEKI